MKGPPPSGCKAVRSFTSIGWTLAECPRRFSRFSALQKGMVMEPPIAGHFAQADAGPKEMVEYPVIAGRWGGKGVVVAVIDSGIDSSLSVFGDRILPGYDFGDNDDDPTDELGHGTEVASIIGARDIGYAPEALLIPLKINKGSEDSFTTESLIPAVLYAINHGARIINLSLVVDEPSQVLEDAIRLSLKRGIVVVAASGNEGKGEVAFPSSIPGVASIGAVDEGGNLAGFSNHGPGLTAVAPGVGVPAYTLSGALVHLSGTSLSAAIVSGLVATAISANPSGYYYPETVVPNGVVDIGELGRDDLYGFGLVKAVNLVDALSHPYVSAGELYLKVGGSTEFQFEDQGAWHVADASSELAVEEEGANHFHIQGAQEATGYVWFYKEEGGSFILRVHVGEVQGLDLALIAPFTHLERGDVFHLYLKASHLTGRSGWVEFWVDQPKKEGGRVRYYYHSDGTWSLYGENYLPPLFSNEVVFGGDVDECLYGPHGLIGEGDTSSDEDLLPPGYYQMGIAYHTHLRDFVSTSVEYIW